MDSHTDSQLEKFSRDLYNTALDLKNTCKSIHNSYVKNAACTKEFDDLRRKVADYVMVYNKLALPIANIVILDIQDFMESYTEPSYEDFKECIEDIAATANRCHDTAYYTKLLHQKLLADLKS